MATNGLPAGSVLIEDPGEVGFLLTGTARSGTTLVQRLICELSEAWVPRETHFWPDAAELAAAFEWPLRGDDRHAASEALLAAVAGGGLPAEPLVVARQMMSRHRRLGLWALFESLVAALSPPDRHMLGEKTPNHMFWWEQIAAAVPSVKLVVVVRNPVDVLRSHRGVFWGEQDAHALAERWIAHQRIAVDAARIHGPERVLILRYEDVVADPEGVRSRIAGFLGVPDIHQALTESLVAEFPLYAPEETWKDGALGKVKAKRKLGWTRVSRQDTAILESACRGLMVEFGYEPRAKQTGEVGPVPPGESLEKVLAFRKWQAAIEAAVELPIY